MVYTKMVYNGNRPFGEVLSISGLNGRLIRWAREQLNLSVRQVRDLGGPATGYQSEIENGGKRNPTAAVRQRWFEILQIPESFARGEIPRYSDQPALCVGLAADVGRQLVNDPSWRAQSPVQRTLTVLRQVCCGSQKLTKTAVAYVLGFSVEGLDDLLAGKWPVGRQQVEVLAVLTDIPVNLLTQTQFSDDEYTPLIAEAKRLGLPPAEALARLRNPGPDARPHLA